MTPAFDSYNVRRRSDAGFTHAIDIAKHQWVTSDPPTAFLHFFNFHPSDPAERFTFNRHHGVGEIDDDLFLLFRGEHIFKDVNVYQWHTISPVLMLWCEECVSCAGSTLTLPGFALHDIECSNALHLL